MSRSEGFLAPGLVSSIAGIRTQYAPWFAVATAFNALGMQVLADRTLAAMTFIEVFIDQDG